MKQNLNSVALLLFLVLLLINTSQLSARKLASKQGEANVNINNISSKKKSVTEIGKNGSFANLMGMEKCQDEDEECLKRRAISEAHLDYIYTQHHNP